MRIKAIFNKQKASSRVKREVYMLALITAVSLFGDSMLYIALPIHWKDAGLLSLVEVGILLSANRFIRLPLNPIISWIYSKISLRQGLFTALVIAGVTTMLYGWAQGFVFWLILRCVWGIAWSFLRLGSYYAILKLSSHDNRGQFMGSFNGWSRIGSLIGMLGGGFLVEWLGMRQVTLLFGLMAFLTLPMIFRIPNIRHMENASRAKLNAASFMRNSPLLWLMVTVFLVMLSLEGMVTATLSHLIDVRIENVHIYDLVIGAAAVASLLQGSRIIISVYLSPWIGGKSDSKWGRRPYLIIILLISSLFIAAAQFEMPVYLWLFTLLAILLTSSMTAVLLDTYASDLADERTKAATVTVYVIVADVGAAFGPTLGYLSEDRFGLSTTYWISAAILCLLAVQWMVVGFSKNVKKMQNLSL